MVKDIICQKIYLKIKEAENILIVSHENPDADAVSSICAFLELLKNLNKKSSAFCQTPPPPYFNFLPHSEKIKSDRNSFDFSSYDLIIALDCGDLKRTALEKEIKSKKDNQFVVNIDHHPKIDDFADLEIKETAAASTTELVYDFFLANKIPINKNEATCILTGIAGDTGNFIYSATTDETVKIASEMVSAGARLPLIIERITRNKSLASLKIWGRAISRLIINKKYDLAFTILSAEEIRESGVEEEDLEGMANFLSNIKGVKAVLFLREAKEYGVLRGSFRSLSPNTDISLLARALGGGGHPKAAGFKIEGRLEENEGKWKVI